jgi:hypothetical protein
MTITYFPTPAERVWITRASAHVQPEHLLNLAARFTKPVTEEGVARVMMALERGTPITQSGHGRWYAPTGSPLKAASLSMTVQEMIRTGLVVHHVSGALVPAKVHLARWDAMQARWTSASPEPGEWRGPKRVRLLEDRELVDCLACLDQL